MKYVVWPLLVLIGIVGLVTLVGWMLPVGHVAARTASVAAAPGAVFAAVRDVARYPDWRSDLKKVDLLDPGGGAVRFREHSSTGAVTMEMVELTPPSRIVTRIADPDQPFGGTWTFEIAPGPGGSTITITERGEVYNPIFRFVARFVFGHHRTLDRYLADLGGHLARAAAS
jgi:uncharacterized protein YndB with AHSA1/START domain